MKKVIVIGCPGSGKSTFARALSQATGLKLVHLDMLYWNANRTIVDKAVFLKRLEKALDGESWIIDGNYASTMEKRLACCDTVFFLDIPAKECLQGIEERRGKAREDMPWIETQEDTELTEFVKSYSTESKPKVMAMLEKYKDKAVFVFKTRQEADEFLKKLT